MRIEGHEANGILCDYAQDSGTYSILITGSVCEQHLTGLDKTVKGHLLLTTGKP